MVTIKTARSMALSLPETEEKSHFSQPDFRVRNKIFAVMHAERKEMMVRLNVVDQSVFCDIDKSMIYPVPGGWGSRGATFVNLQKVNKAILRDALITAWKT